MHFHCIVTQQIFVLFLTVDVFVVSLCLFSTLGSRQNGCLLQATFSNQFSCVKNCCILIQISSRLVRKDPFGNKPVLVQIMAYPLQWRHNGRDCVSNHQPHQCLLNHLFGCRSKKTSKLRVTGLCAGNSPGTGEFPAQMASYAENVSIWWRHHALNWYQAIIWNIGGLVYWRMCHSVSIS